MVTYDPLFPRCSRPQGREQDTARNQCPGRDEADGEPFMRMTAPSAVTTGSDTPTPTSVASRKLPALWSRGLAAAGPRSESCVGGQRESAPPRADRCRLRWSQRREKHQRDCAGCQSHRREADAVEEARADGRAGQQRVRREADECAQRAGRPYPFTYASFSDTRPSRTRNTSTPRRCQGLPSRILR